MYAVYRETFALIENGHTSMENIDKALRYDAGSWITLMGIFRRMDFMGLENQQEVVPIRNSVLKQLAHPGC